MNEIQVTIPIDVLPETVIDMPAGKLVGVEVDPEGNIKLTVASEEPIAQVRAYFDANGGMNVATRSINPWQMWAAAHMIQVMGDDLYRMIQGENQRRMNALQQAVPDLSALKPRGRG